MIGALSYFLSLTRGPVFWVPYIAVMVVLGVAVVRGAREHRERGK